MKYKIERFAEDNSITPQADVLPQLQQFCKKNGIWMSVSFRNIPLDKEDMLIAFLQENNFMSDNLIGCNEDAP